MVVWQTSEAIPLITLPGATHKRSLKVVRAIILFHFFAHAFQFSTGFFILSMVELIICKVKNLK
jgi:hypothetical protein